ncbi:MAG: carbonic anhydrase [Rhabdochlamydiaceae bacterium]|jgi:carbonic anhydrase
MMKIAGKLCFIFLLGFTGAALQAAEETPIQQMRNMMKNILVDNQLFRDDPSHDEEFFKRQSQTQHPRTTLVACSDSRVHTSSFDLHPLRDVFFVRNIGNQLETCQGSIDYGIKHLHTPLLLVLAHSNCGAVIAVTKGTQELEESIRRELAPMHVIHQTPNPTDQQIAENVLSNLHDQVNKAYTIYQDLVTAGKLWIVGALMILPPKGKGQITIVQVNNQTDETSLSEFLEDVQTHGIYCDDPGRELTKAKQQSGY